MDAIGELKKTRLMVLACGVPKDVLLKAVAANEEAGVTVFESTFDHRARIVLTDEEVEKRRSRWPVGQESTPEQIASAVAFLCSDAAGTISGAEIPIDSGIGACLLAYNKNWIQNDPYNVKYWEKKNS